MVLLAVWVLVRARVAVWLVLLGDLVLQPPVVVGGVARVVEVVVAFVHFPLGLEPAEQSLLREPFDVFVDRLPGRLGELGQRVGLGTVQQQGLRQL